VEQTPKETYLVKGCLLPGKQMLVLILAFSSHLCSLVFNFQLCAGAGYQPVAGYMTVNQADATFCILFYFFFCIVDVSSF